MTLPRLTVACLAALMSAAPVASFAQHVCESEKAQSCAVGYVWDADTKSCVQVSS